MTWEQLVVPVLLVLALLVQLMRVLKGTVEEAQGNEAEAASIHLSMTKRVPILESRGPSDEPPVARPAMDAFPATRRRRPRVRLLHMQEARRGIVLMAVLGPCRGLERSAPLGE